MCTITAYAAGATDKQVLLRGYTASTGVPYTAGAYDTSGITAKYRRAGANAEATITLATQTANGAHSDGGFVHISGGVYRLDLPDAALATGADYVEVWVYGITDVVFSMAHIDIMGADPRGATVALATGGIAAATFAAGAIDAAAIAADAGTEIGTAVWATATRTLTALDEDSTTIDLNGAIEAATATSLTAAGITAANGITKIAGVDLGLAGTGGQGIGAA